MNRIRGVWVDTDEIISGDYSSLENAFDYCGIPLNVGIAEEQIDRKLWHHNISST